MNNRAAARPRRARDRRDTSRRITAICSMAALALVASGTVGAAGRADVLPPVALRSAPPVHTISKVPTPPSTGWPSGCVDTGQSLDLDVEASLAANPIDPDNLVATWWTAQTNFAGLARVGGVGVTGDGGGSWRIDYPHGIDLCGGNLDHATAGAHDPWVTVAPDGHVYMLFESGAGPGPATDNPTIAVWLIQSGDGGRTWSHPHDILDGTTVPGNVDQPRLAVDPKDSKHLLLVWRQLPPTTAATGDTLVATAAWFSTSTDGGEHWASAGQIYQPGESSVADLQPTVLADGSFVVVFSTEDQSVAAGDVIDQEGTVGAPDPVLAARSSDNGGSWGLTKIGEDSGVNQVPDPDKGWPGTTDGTGYLAENLNIPVTAMAPDGTLWVAWGYTTQSYKPAKLFISSCRPASPASPVGSGLSCTPPRATGLSSIEFASLAVAGDGTLGILHYDTPNDTPGDSFWTTDVYLARSVDAGTTWTDEHVGGPFNLADAPVAASEGPGGQIVFLGDYLNGLVGLRHDFAGVFPMVTSEWTAAKAAGTSASNPTDIYFGRWPSRLSARS